MLTSLGYVFLGGMAGAYIFGKLKLPGFLGMLLAGMLLGPPLLGMLDDSILRISGDLRRLALVIILARVGLSLDLNDLKALGRSALLMCFVPATLEIIGITLLAPPLLGVTTLEAAMIGTVAAGVSPAVIVPRMLRLMENGYGREKGIPQLLMGGASADNIYVIVLFSALLEMAGGGEGWSAVSFARIPAAVVGGAAAGAAAGWGLAQWVTRFRVRDTVGLLVFLSLSFLFVALEQSGKIPFSGLLAVAGTGLMFLKCRPEAARRLALKFSGIWVGAEVLLFVLVGAMVDPGYAMVEGGVIALMVAAALGLRAVGVWICLAGTRLNGRERWFCMWVYVPKATVQAAIGAVPLGMGLECGRTVFAVAVISIVLTAPLGALMIDWTCKNIFEQID